MSEWKDRYAGRTAAVLGGGPSLPGDMARLPECCVLIAVNHHALRLCAAEFIVYNDQPTGELAEAVALGRAIRVSAEPTSDIVFDMAVWTGFYSSNTATWFALHLGCDPVILCGMDCYQGERAYFHEYDDQPQFHLGIEHHMQPWVEDAKNMLPCWERVRAMSGPLAAVFGLYEGEYA